MARYFHELLFSLLQFLKASTTVKKELFLLKHYIDLLYSKQTRFDCTSYLLISLLLKSCTWGKNNSIFWILPLILLCPTPLVKDKQSYVLVSLKYKKVSTKTVMSMCIASAVNLGYSWFEAVIISQKKWMFKCSFELIVKKNGSGKSRITSQQSFLFCLGFFIAHVMHWFGIPQSYFHLNSNVNEQPLQTKWLQYEFQLVEDSHSQAGECFPIAKITYRAVHKSWSRETDLLVVLPLIMQTNRLLVWIVVILNNLSPSGSWQIIDPM